jgi:hypothetical protein
MLMVPPPLIFDKQGQEVVFEAPLTELKYLDLE